MSKNFLGKWISLLYRYGHVYMAMELQPYNIGKGQFLFLMGLYQQDGLTQEELAEYLNIDKGTTARAISKLEQYGYVTRKPNQEDLRSNRVFLTQKAKDFKPILHLMLDKWTQILSTGMTKEEVESALILLEKMAGNAKEYIQKERITLEGREEKRANEGTK